MANSSSTTVVAVSSVCGSSFFGTSISVVGSSTTDLVTSTTSTGSLNSSWDSASSTVACSVSSMLSGSPASSTTQTVATSVSGATTTDAIPLYSTVTGAAAACSPISNGKIVNESLPFTAFPSNGNSSEWPTWDMWITYESLQKLNPLALACEWSNVTVLPNTANETAALYSAIDELSNNTCVDRRFILATIIQESSGCVRVPTTMGAVSNPGLMQSHNGNGSCANIDPPCPATMITQMVYDGVTGGAPRSDQNNQVLALNTVQTMDNVTGAMAYYHAAMFYAAGANADRQQLNNYTMKIANRLVGWV